MATMAKTHIRVLIKTDRQRVSLAQLSDLAVWLRPHLEHAAAFGAAWQWSYQDWGVIFTLDGDERTALDAVRGAVADCPFPINGVEVLDERS